MAKENKYAHLKRMLLLAAFAFIAYSNSFDSAFHFDDYSSIIAQAYIKALHNIPYFFYYEGSPLVSRPVTMATFALNYEIGGLEPSSYHYVNFFIHLANSLLAYALLLLTLKGRIDEHVNVSFLAALMFAVHPVGTQAVTYIVQRAEILSAFFYLLSLVLFVKAGMQDAGYRSERLVVIDSIRDYEIRDTESDGKKVTVRPAARIMNYASELELRVTRYTLYALSFVSAVFAMGSKEISVTLPFMILLYDFFFISDGSVKRLSRSRLIHILLFLSLIPLVYFMGAAQLKTFIATNSVASPPTSSIYAGTEAITRYEYLLTQFRVIWVYIILLIFPVNQNLDYSFPVSKTILEPVTTLPSLIGIVLLLTSAFFLFKRQRFMSFFIFWFFIILAPTSSVAALPDVIYEHRVYLSSLGYFAIFAAGIFKAADVLFNKRKTP